MTLCARYSELYLAYDVEFLRIPPAGGAQRQKSLVIAEATELRRTRHER